MFVTEALAQKVLTAVDAGLIRGMGVQIPGQMCVEAAVCYALNLPHSDKPPCVHEVVRAFKICLNDANWSSDAARAKGMRRVAVAQLGSLHIDSRKFVELLVIGTVNKILPPLLRKANLESYAAQCEKTVTFNEARAVAYAAADAAADAAAAASAAYAVAYAAARAAAASAASAAYAVADAAASAAYATASAAYAVARAAARAAGAGAAAGAADAILSMSAEMAVQALITCGSEGSKFLYLCD